MSDLFDQEQYDPEPRRRSLALPITAGVILALIVSISVLASIWTEKLWFDSTGFSGVFSTMLLTRVALFVVFGGLMVAVVAASMAVAYRMRPVLGFPFDEAGLDRYRDVVQPMRRWVWIGISLVFGLFTGMSAAGQWRTFLMWRNGTAFGEKDPYFGRDLGFYVFDLPWWQFLVDFAMAAAVIGLLAAAVVHYLFGGIQLQGRQRLTPGARAQLSLLVGVFVLAKAFDYWLSRFDLVTTSNPLMTGMTYTNHNAVLPARNIMAGIALICAVLFFVNIWRRSWTLATTGLALMLVSAILVGGLWPGLVQRFQVKPSEPDKEGPYLQRNIDATRKAFDIDHVEPVEYPGTVSVDRATLRQEAFANGIRLVDPALVSETFEQQQQVRGYYSMSDVLDVDRYEVNGQMRDVVLAAREVNQAGIPDDAKNWNNLHTVFTHGYGLVAAFGNQRDESDENPVPNGEVSWMEQNLPPSGLLSEMGYEGRIYFGEQSPSYSIVGKTPDGPDIELDLPEGTDGATVTPTTYDGEAGVPVGSALTKLLYAVKFGEPNIVLSSRVHDDSKILYDRDPRVMVEKVAPWLTVDADPFPAVVDGRIMWILDGYTTTDRYPLSQKESFETMTDDALEQRPTFATLPTDEINYIRNAVKATVDAYDGTVTLYAWDEEDPILKAWESAFPGTVQPRSEIPEPLLDHLRYPEDLFKVQRYQLAAYHVTDADDFYAKNDQWRVPEDPNVAGKLQPPYRLSVVVPGAESSEPKFSLTSVYTPHNRANLEAFVSVNAEASDPETYGEFTVLALKGGEQIPGPGQIANVFNADQGLRDALLRYTQNQTKVVSGNLLTLPVGNGLMYVQPIYSIRSGGEGNYPVPRFVVVAIGENVGFGTNLDEAIADILGVAPDDPSIEPDPGEGDGEGEGEPTGKINAQIRDLLEKAQAAYDEADRLQRAGDTAGWARELEKARDFIDRAFELAEKR